MVSGRAETSHRSHVSAQPDSPTSPADMQPDVVHASCVPSCMFLADMLRHGLWQGCDQSARPLISPTSPAGMLFDLLQASCVHSCLFFCAFVTIYVFPALFCFSMASGGAAPSQPSHHAAQPDSPASPGGMLSDLVHASCGNLCLLINITSAGAVDQEFVYM